MSFFFIYLFYSLLVAAETEIADMGEIAKRAGSVGYLHPTGNEQVNLICDGKRELGVFHTMPPKEVTRRGALESEAWRVLFRVKLSAKITPNNPIVIIFFIMMIMMDCPPGPEVQQKHS